MSSGSNGGTTVQSSSNSSSLSGPPIQTGWMMNELAGQQYGDYQKNPHAPNLFPGRMTAPLSPQTEAALDAMTRRGNFRSPALDAAGRSVTDTLGSRFLDIDSNPYFRKALAAGFEPQTDKFWNVDAPMLRSQAAGAGRTGSPADYSLLSRGLGDLNRAQAQAAAGASLGAYQDERGNQMTALGLAPQIARTASDIDLQNIQALAQAGAITDRQAQALLDEQIDRWNYDQTKDQNYRVHLARQLQSIYPGGSTRGSGTSWATQMQPGGGGLGDIFGAAAGAASLGMQAYNTFSDRRDKTDIEKLGVDPLTGLLLYAYRYRSDPKSYPKVVGPMAQDIAARGGPVREIGRHKVIEGGLS